jgi:DNA-3-methyladenine glycosylase I
MPAALYRCPWCGDDPLYVKYHDEEWGVPSFDDRHLFEKLCLEAQQAGLSWITVLKKRDAYRREFFNFEVKKVARLSDADLALKVTNAELIRHLAKLAAIRDNAIATLAIQQEFGSLSEFLWGFVGGKPVINRLQDYRQGDTQTDVSVALAKALKKRGFKFLGPTSCYAFMQGVGMVNDHEQRCFRYRELRT